MRMVEEKIIEVNSIDKVKLVTYEFRDGKRMNSLFDGNDNLIIPLLNSISVTDIPGLFEVEDTIVINENITGTLYYFMNYEGIPVGFAYCNVFPNEFISLGLDSNSEYIRWYQSRKKRLAQQFSERITDKTNSDIAKNKSLALYKKRVIESENKI